MSRRSPSPRAPVDMAAIRRAHARADRQARAHTHLEIALRALNSGFYEDALRSLGYARDDIAILAIDGAEA